MQHFIARPAFLLMTLAISGGLRRRSICARLVGCRTFRARRWFHITPQLRWLPSHKRSPRSPPADIPLLYAFTA